MKIVGLVSSFDEGPLLRSAVRSLAALDHVLVFEGPVEGNPYGGRYNDQLPKQDGRVTVIEGTWPTDAAKRTAMVEWCHARRWLQGEEVWGLWLDGDEILLWGEYLHDWVWAVSTRDSDGDTRAGLPLSLVELDGSVAWCMGKLVRVDLIRRYLISSSYLELVNGATITVGNVDAWNPLDGPLQFSDADRGLPHWRARPPLQGEPHLQHRPMLRDRRRLAERQHKAETRNFEGVELG